MISRHYADQSQNKVTKTNPQHLCSSIEYLFILKLHKFALAFAIIIEKCSSLHQKIPFLKPIVQQFLLSV